MQFSLRERAVKIHVSDSHGDRLQGAYYDRTNLKRFPIWISNSKYHSWKFTLPGKFNPYISLTEDRKSNKW
jgi:hypothetical protein